MQKVLLILLFSGFFAEAKSQTIKGVVRDQLTDSPLNYAIIYIGGTSLGTYSDAAGRFELDISRFSSLPVTISLLGYQSVTLTQGIDNPFRSQGRPRPRAVKTALIAATREAHLDLSWQD